MSAHYSMIYAQSNRCILRFDSRPILFSRPLVAFVAAFLSDKDCKLPLHKTFGRLKPRSSNSDNQTGGHHTFWLVVNPTPNGRPSCLTRFAQEVKEGRSECCGKVDKKLTSNCRLGWQLAARDLMVGRE